MDREANLPVPSAPPQRNLVRPVINSAETTSSSSSSFSSSSSSPPDFLQHVQAAFKRHRPLEMEWDMSSQVELSNVINDETKQQNFQNMESDVTLRSDGAVPSLGKRTMVIQKQLHQLRNFLSQPATQSSVVGQSYATTTSVHSTSAPMLNSMTYCSHESGSQAAVKPLRDANANSQHSTPGILEKLSYPTLKDTRIDLRATATQPSTSAIHSQFKEGVVPEVSDIANNPSHVDRPTKDTGPADDGADVQSQPPMSKNPSSDVKLEPPKPEKQEKNVSKGTSMPRKRSYDPDLFFKVNGKLYQRLGKIGSGGSSEVHKVISSDCTIYALKKIKLKGRDYGTAYGFCQEILYLNKLKGKNNIIQLIDYEVTDKTLLREVMSSSVSNKDGRVKDDGCIYMVLEYGEIDLAHMLSQKWKDMDSSNQMIDENWLRFYWQQILQAVNIIHEERIVHSDLKPANFLLVKGSLKLIDFGIAKALMSDTTNIQRDSQVD
ncbi:hypothetical protein OIU78_022189 [Salix suchowensis]|nr:hypothetical protein OIU78_022189 [Salix suchowensis]